MRGTRRFIDGNNNRMLTGRLYRKPRARCGTGELRQQRSDAAISKPLTTAAHRGRSRMPEAKQLISGDALRGAALRYSGDMRARIQNEQGGLLSIFDGWFTRVVARLLQFDPARFWEDSVRDYAAQSPQGRDLQWDLLRLRQFLDRRQQGRFVEFSERERGAAFYQPRFGTEFGVDVQLTCQGAPSLIHWRGTAMMKNVFDFAMYPALIGELRPRTVFEIGSGLGASAAWFADTMTFCGIEGSVHSVDLVKPAAEHPRVKFHHGDCSDPRALVRSEPS